MSQEQYTFEVGQEFAFYPNYSQIPEIATVVKVTPSGMAKLSDGQVIEKNLRIRGAQKWGPYWVHEVTQEMRDKSEHNYLAQLLRSTLWSLKDLSTLRAVRDLLDQHKQGD